MASGMMARLDLRLLGGFQVRLGTGPPLALPAKAQALLAYLALRPGVGHPRDKLASLLWGDTGEAQARDSLRHTFAALRKALDVATGDVLIVESQSFAFDPDAIDVDVVRFERRVAEATPAALEEAVARMQQIARPGSGTVRSDRLPTAPPHCRTLAVADSPRDPESPTAK